MSLNFVYDPKLISHQEWLNFVQSHPKGTIFQSPQMYNLFNRAENYEPVFICAVDNQNKIKGLMLSVIFSEKKGFLGRLTSRSIIQGGPLLTSNVLTHNFLMKYESLIKRRTVYTRLINYFDNKNQFSDIDIIGYHYNKHLNYIIDLNVPENVLWERMHNTKRRQIRRGYRRGLKVEISSGMDSFEEYYDILFKTYSRAGQPLQNISFFRSAIEELGKSNNLVFFSAYYNFKLVGFRIALIFNGIMHDWYAGDLNEARDKYTNDILVWEALKWGNNNNLKLFDFGGAGEPGKEYGVREFKKKFGGKLVSYGNFLKIHQSIKYNILKLMLPMYKFYKKKLG